MRITPKHAFAFEFHADKRSVERHAVDERLGAVDGIENPAIAAFAFPFGKFLAQNGVVGKGFGDHAPQFRFRQPIGHGDRRIVGLEIDGQIVLAKIFQRDIARHPGGMNGEFQTAFDFGGMTIRHFVVHFSFLGIFFDAIPISKSRPKL